jgi:hypothetical protein
MALLLADQADGLVGAGLFAVCDRDRRTLAGEQKGHGAPVADHRKGAGVKLALDRVAGVTLPTADDQDAPAAQPPAPGRPA